MRFTSRPTQLRPQPSTRPGARALRGTIGVRPPQRAKDRAPCQPHASTLEAPQYAGSTQSCTAYPRHTELAGQPLHQSEAIPLITPRSKKIQTIMRELKRQPQHQSTPNTQLPTRAQTLTTKTIPSPGLQTQQQTVISLFHITAILLFVEKN
ncbi:hypothetical protein AMECASPLE_027996 [Ameca splendens]|uniref:Uncharacterized protein n=1 Tax=Ameca splendens TaxID=208324 RepID=A0ABV0ZE80_9TELE